MPVDASRLKSIGPITYGNHEEGHGLCVMEAVAYVAGEKHTDSPKCASPILTELMIAINDGIGAGVSADRTRGRLLRPYVLRLAGTRDHRNERKRGRVIRRWLLGVDPDCASHDSYIETDTYAAQEAGDMIAAAERRSHRRLGKRLVHALIRMTEPKPDRSQVAELRKKAAPSHIKKLHMQKLLKTQS